MFFCLFSFFFFQKREGGGGGGGFCGIKLFFNFLNMDGIWYANVLVCIILQTKVLWFTVKAWKKLQNGHLFKKSYIEENKMDLKVHVL